MSSTPPPDLQTVAADATSSTAKEEATNALEQLIGKTVADRYLVKSLLGEGGMGAVFLAEHVMMKKPVALKILHGELSSNQEIVARFQREARAAAAINHPNICAATDFGRLDDGAFFLVMEFLDGRTLDSVLRARQRLQPARAIHIVDQILSVLELAHSKGIVHRDLKPENVMLVDWDGQDDVVKVMDFGIASMRLGDEDEDTRLTRAGVAYGTPTYMSPEQVAGQQDIDGRADLYTLGAMFFEMLTGQPPFDGKSITALMSQHLTKAPPSLSEMPAVPTFAPELEAIVKKMLEKEREDRFQDAASLRHALEQLPEQLTSNAPNNNLALATAPTSAMESTLKIHERRTPPAPTLLVEAKERFDAMPQHFQFAALGIPILFGLIAVGAILAIGLAATDEPLPEDPTERAAVKSAELTKDLAEERDAFISSIDGMRPALEKMAAGDHTEARGMLEKMSSGLENNPHFHYYMGLAQDADKKHGAALESFEKTISLEPRYNQDEKIAEIVIEAFDRKKTRDKASAMLDGDLLEAATPKLAKLASDDGNKKTREAAIQLLKEKKRWESLAPWRQHTIEFKNTTGCANRREIIVKLEKDEDPRALDVLREYADKPKRGCGLLKNKDCYSCIRSELDRAITTLEKAHPDYKSKKEE